MADFFDLENFKGRKELQPDDVSCFMEMQPRDQAVAIAHLAVHDLAFVDDVEILQNIMAAPDQVRLRAIIQNDAEAYARLDYLGLGPETLKDEQDDLLHAFKFAAGSVTNQILGTSHEHLGDDAFMTDTRTRLIRYGNLPAIKLFLEYDPHLNTPNSWGETALQTLSQTVYDSVHDDEPFVDDEFPLHPANVASVAYFPILRCLLEKGAELFPEGNIAYRLKDDEIPERPELAFAKLAEKDPLFNIYLEALEARFPEASSAYARRKIQCLAQSGLSVVGPTQQTPEPPKDIIRNRANLKQVL